jgi:hypothetical protein
MMGQHTRCEALFLVLPAGRSGPMTRLTALHPPEHQPLASLQPRSRLLDSARERTRAVTDSEADGKTIPYESADSFWIGRDVSGDLKIGCGRVAFPNIISD